MMLAYMFALFVALTPGVFVTLPPHCSKYVVAATHALIFTIIWYFTHKMLRPAAEGFAGPLFSECSNNEDCNSRNCVNNLCAE